MKVITDGKKPVQYDLKEGDAMTLHGEKSFNLLIGNGHAVKVRLAFLPCFFFDNPFRLGSGSMGRNVSLRRRTDIELEPPRAPALDLRAPNAYRTASGRPGHAYWQQKVDYLPLPLPQLSYYRFG